MSHSRSLALLIGIGARILLHQIHRNDASAVVDSEYTSIPIAWHIFTGVWQGILVHFLLAEFPLIAPGLFLGIGFRVVGAIFTLWSGWHNHSGEGVIHGVGATVGCLFGMALGVLAAEVVEGGRFAQRPRRSHRPYPTRHDPSQKMPASPDSPSNHTLTDAGTLFGRISPLPDSSSVEPLSHPITEMEMEIAELQGQAASAIAAKRRFQEERKWAWAQGNPAWAFQLAWQIKRYEALEQSFKKEAKRKMKEFESKQWAVRVDIRDSYIGEIIDAIDQRLQEAHRRGKMRLRVLFSAPKDKDFLENEVKPAVLHHLRRLRHRVAEDHLDPQLIYIDVEPDEGSTIAPPRSDDWSRALD